MSKPIRNHVQEGPYPEELADLVERARFRPGYKMWLADHDDQGCRGLSLWVRTDEQDSYHPEQRLPVHHIFYVPTAAYNRESWCWWLFQRLQAVMQHESMEWFRLAEGDGEHRPYAPLHSPGWDPYLITITASVEDKRTSFRGELNEGTP